MHVKVLDCEDLFAQLAGHEIWIEKPTWEQIEEGIDNLDGNGHSIVVLQKEIVGGEFMVIGGGGSDHRYVCFIRTPEPDRLDWQLINPSGSTSLTAKIMVAEMVELSLRDCVTYTDVLQAAETYALSGTKDESLHWEQLELKTKFTWLEEKTLSEDSPQREIHEQKQPSTTKTKEIQQLQQQLDSQRKQLASLKSQQIDLEKRIENNRKTDLFDRNQGRLDREKDELIQQIKEVKNKITKNESLIEVKKEQGQQD